jgi:imidazoleglycerol phosphate synthase glutamine amidotransferase subunit HisH
MLPEFIWAANLLSATSEQTYVATQFHPEKSQAVGLQLLKIFTEVAKA